jgi:hypothetical protein
MKYLKFFKTEADYNVYVKRGMTIPNISYIKEGDIIKYYYPKLILTYEGEGFAFTKRENMSMIVVDDENVTDTISNNANYYFKTSGKHTVEIELSTRHFPCIFDSNTNISIFDAPKILKSVIISSSITSISNNIFHGCTGLTSIIIPDSVTSIGASAFQGCTGLTSIIIPDSVTSIGADAFYGCTGLTSIIIPDSVTSIGADAFYGCTGLTSITCNAEKAPHFSDFAFDNIAYDGKLYVPEGSDYSSWMYRIKGYNWTIQYI